VQWCVIKIIPSDLFLVVCSGFLISEFSIKALVRAHKYAIAPDHLKQLQLHLNKVRAPPSAQYKTLRYPARAADRIG
jgi:hypothetical protein